MPSLLKSLRDPYRTVEGRLLFPSAGDGVVETVDAGCPGVKAPRDHYLYFRLFDPGRWNRLGRLYMTVECQGRGVEVCQYSSKDPRKSNLENCYNRAEEHYVEPERSDRTRTSVFLLADPAFGHRMNYGADIRLQLYEDSTVTGFHLDAGFRERHRFTLVPEISTFLLEITSACNFDCPYCASAFAKRERGVMPFSRALGIIDQLASLQNLPHLNLHILGEPMLHPDFQKILEHCREKRVPVVLFTNGSLFDRENVEALLDASPLAVNLSCHTDQPDSWDVRRPPLPVEEYEKRILHLLEAKIRRKAATTIRMHYLNSFYTQRYTYRMVHSPAHAVAIIRKWSKVVDQIESKYGVKSQRPDPEGCWNILAQEATSQAMCQIAPGIDVVFMFLHHWGNQYLGDRVVPAKYGVCHVPFETLGVFWNGNATICCLDADGRINIGDACTQSIEEIWLGEKRRELLDHFVRNRVMHPLCRRCLAKVSRDSLLGALHGLCERLPDRLRNASVIKRPYGLVRKYFRYFSDHADDGL